MSKRAQGNKQHDQERSAATHLPEIALGFGGADDSGEVHAVVGCEEGEWQEDDGHAGEDEDGFVLRVGDDGEFVLFDVAELEELCGKGGVS